MPREPKSYPTPLQRQLMWTCLAALSTVVLGSLAVGGIFLVSWVLGYLQPILVPVAIAGILAYLLLPIIRLLQTRLSWSRERSFLTVYSSFLLFGVVLSFLVVYPSVKQARAFTEDYLTPIPILSGESATPGEPQPTSTKLAQRTKDLLRRVDDRFGPRLEGLSSMQRFRIPDEDRWDLAEMGKWLWEKLNGFVDEVALFFGRGFSSAFAFVGYLFGLFLTPLYLFYFLRESKTISDTWTRYIPLRASLLKDEIVATLKATNQYLIAYVRGQMIVSLIDGVIVALALAAIGLPYALLLGVFLAILGLIPYLGSLLVMIPAAILAIFHYGSTKVGVWQGETAPAVGDNTKILTPTGDLISGVVQKLGADGMVQILPNVWPWLPQVWAYPVIVIGIFIILQQINGLVTAPKIVGDSVGLHPITVIFSMLFWSLLLGGLLGALLAVPLTAGLKVLFQRYIWGPKLPSEDRLLPSDEVPDDPSPEPAS
ncbi:MAG: AI-2E family transporter [Verrucomicrobiota bacterium]